MQLDNPLWKFSLRVYAAPGVADECLRLQRTQGANVNMLLFCSWMATFHQTALSTHEIRSIEDAIEDWHSLTVLPLRQLRQQLKSCAEIGKTEVQVFRKTVLAVEIQAEQIEQAILFDLGERVPPRRDRGSAREIITSNLSKIIEPAESEADIASLVLASLAT